MNIFTLRHAHANIIIVFIERVYSLRSQSSLVTVKDEVSLPAVCALCIICCWYVSEFNYFGHNDIVLRLIFSYLSAAVSVGMYSS